MLGSKAFLYFLVSMLERKTGKLLYQYVGETGEDWDIFHICCSSLETKRDSFFSEFCTEKGNHRLTNPIQTFCCYFR